MTRPTDTPQRPSRFRQFFRWTRRGLLVLLFLVAGAILWANLFGFPASAKARVKEALLRRGVALEFTNLRLKGLRRVIAEDLRIESLSGTNAPRLEVSEAELLVRYKKLAAGELDLSGLRISSGRLEIPVGEGRSLKVTNIDTELRFLPNDALRLVAFSAETLGAKTTLSGEIKGVSEFRTQGPDRRPGGADWRGHLAEVLEIAEELEFQSPPEMNLTFSADATNITSTRISVRLRSGPASSKWGTIDRLLLNSSVYPESSNGTVRGIFSSELAGLRSPFGRIENLRVEGGTLWLQNMNQLVTNHVEVTARSVDSRWIYSERASATLSSSQVTAAGPIRSSIELITGAAEAAGARIATNRFGASLSHPLPFPTPASWLGKFLAPHPSSVPSARANDFLEGDWQLESSGFSTDRARIGSIRLNGAFSTVSTNRALDPNLAYWRSVSRFESPWQMLVTNIQAGEIDIGSIQARGNWSFPELHLSELNAQLYGGYLQASGKLNAESRFVTASARGDFAYHEIAVLLDAPVQRWLSSFSWDDPPFVEASVSFQLPEWTAEWEKPERQILPSLGISGRFEGSGRFREIAAEAAASHFRFTNFVWHLPNLVITRPEGQAQLAYSGNVTNGSFQLKLDSRIDPGILRPLFPEEQQLAFDFVKFADPPHVLAEASGNFDQIEEISVAGSIVATNFFIKEQAFSDVQAGFWITNSLIHLTNIIGHRGKEELRAPYVRVDLPGEIMFVTNAISTMDPYIAMSLVGDDAYEAIDPYRFAVTPTVRINGIVPLRHWSKADIHFEVAGNEFTFWRFRLPSLVGDVHWKADHISFSNITASFYGGKARWSGYFIIDHTDDSANFSFTGSTTNTELGSLVADLFNVTNHLAGTLDGDLVITSANSKRMESSWNGYGSATLSEGFLWNVPVFGIFTPVLDSIIPGLGSTPVTSGTGSFTIRNSVVHTRDMQVRAPAFRLNYKGEVDIEGRLDATVEAEILRDAWVVGKLFSMALWPVSKAFEARVSGSLADPKTDLRYFPKFLLAPFRMFTPREDSSRTRQGPQPSDSRPAVSPP